MANLVERKLNLAIKKELESLAKKKLAKKFVRELGNETAEQIKKRVRLGYGVERDNAPKTKFPPLSEKYVKYRKKKSSRLGEFARPSKSNLNATGQLIKSITSEVLGVGKNASFRLFFKENRKKELDGGSARVKHRDLAGYVQENGRPFFFLAKFEINKIKSSIVDLFNK